MFRFTIRDVLWLMVVVGLACGWWLSYRHWSETNRLLAADRGEWLRRAIYMKAMFKQTDKSQSYDIEFLNGGKFRMHGIERPLLTDEERELILSDAAIP